MLSIPLHHETLRELGGGLAVGDIRVLDDHDCIVALVRDQLAFILDQPGRPMPGLPSGVTPDKRVAG